MIDLRFQNTLDQRNHGQLTLVGPLFTRQISGRLGRFLGIELECLITVVREDRPNGDLIARKSYPVLVPAQDGLSPDETEVQASDVSL